MPILRPVTGTLREREKDTLAKCTFFPSNCNAKKSGNPENMSKPPPAPQIKIFSQARNCLRNVGSSINGSRELKHFLLLYVPRVSLHEPGRRSVLSSAALFGDIWRFAPRPYLRLIPRISKCNSTVRQVCCSNCNQSSTLRRVALPVANNPRWSPQCRTLR